jgi:hypothetical protein
MIRQRSIHHNSIGVNGNAFDSSTQQAPNPLATARSLLLLAANKSSTSSSSTSNSNEGAQTVNNGFRSNGLERRSSLTRQPSFGGSSQHHKRLSGSSASDIFHLTSLRKGVAPPSMNNANGLHAQASPTTSSISARGSLTGGPGLIVTPIMAPQHLSSMTLTLQMDTIDDWNTHNNDDTTRQTQRRRVAHNATVAATRQGRRHPSIPSTSTQTSGGPSLASYGGGGFGALAAQTNPFGPSPSLSGQSMSSSPMMNQSYPSPRRPISPPQPLLPAPGNTSGNGARRRRRRLRSISSVVTAASRRWAKVRLIFGCISAWKSCVTSLAVQWFKEHDTNIDKEDMRMAMNELRLNAREFWDMIKGQRIASEHHEWFVVPTERELIERCEQEKAAICTLDRRGLVQLFLSDDQAEPSLLEQGDLTMYTIFGHIERETVKFDPRLLRIVNLVNIIGIEFLNICVT